MTRFHDRLYPDARVSDPPRIVAARAVSQPETCYIRRPDMSLGPSGETGNAGEAAGDEFDTAHRTLSLLNTAAQVALKTREDAGDEAQRVIAGAHEEAERIRAEARGDSPELRRPPNSYARSCSAVSMPSRRCATSSALCWRPIGRRSSPPTDSGPSRPLCRCEALVTSRSEKPPSFLCAAAPVNDRVDDADARRAGAGPVALTQLRWAPSRMRRHAGAGPSEHGQTAVRRCPLYCAISSVPPR